MASVTFPPAIGGDGSTVTDDANPSTGLANGGHRLRFVPALAQLVAVAANAVASAAAALASKNSAATSEGNAATSATNAQNSFVAADVKYLGAKASAPTLNNQGGALLTGATYFNTSNVNGYTWSGSAWVLSTFVPTAASGVSFAPIGYVTATNVQAAIAQLAAKKYPGATVYSANKFGAF